MDQDMEEVEIVFAQRLAGGEPNVRKRALRLLHEHIKEETAKNALTPDSLARLCKGLHYALWMQDKMILQEELVDNICQLTALFHGDETKVLEFAQTMLLSLSKEWPSIDRWRMDKFLMLVRRLIRALFGRLSASKWDDAVSAQYLAFFTGTLLSPRSPQICDSLKFHCASVWLDELDNAGGQGLTRERCLQFVRPYVQLLKEENISDTFFRTICTDIFDTILHDFSEQVAQREAAKLEEEREEERGENVVGDEDEAGNDGGDGKAVEEEAGEDSREEPSGALEFDYAKIAELLFDAGKWQKMPARRRKRVYALCKKFENAAHGVNPYPPPPIEDGPKRKRKRRAAGKGPKGGKQ